MALKMPKARLAEPSGVVTTVNADSYDKATRPGTLLCIDNRCDARLKHVRRHLQGHSKVQAHFARNPNAVHARDCKFDVAATVTRISDRSKRFEPDRDPIDVGPDGTAVFRLNIVFEALANLGRTTVADDAGDRDRESVETIAGDRTLTPYLRRARAVLALLARLGDSDELRSAIRISYGGAVLPWQDFFYGPGELGRLYDRLRVLDGRNKPIHPVAVVVRPKNVLNTVRDAVVNCKSEKLRVESGGDLRIVPRLACRPPALAQSLVDLRPYLVCTIPRPRRGDLNLRPAPGATAFADVYMDVVSRNQFALWPH